MVRRIVGVLAAVGRGEMDPSAAARLFEAPTGDDSTAALTAPAAGLFLEAVLYVGDLPPGPPRPVLFIE
jgi:tRNA U38,U39,U40 pseudouridine synthase TruA